MVEPTWPRACGVWGWLAGAALFSCACTPTRDYPIVACTATSQCPADGNHYCNTERHVCEVCDGACESGVDAADDAATDIKYDLPLDVSFAADVGKVDAAVDTTQTSDVSIDAVADEHSGDVWLPSDASAGDAGSDSDINDVKAE